MLGRYLEAKVGGGVFNQSRDVMEFLVKGDVVDYRCMATKVTFVYPFTTAFGDSKGQEERMKKLIDELDDVCYTNYDFFCIEKNVVFQLLIEKFKHEEQAYIVWQFLCSIPVNMLAVFLPWLASSISVDESKEMQTCLSKIVPDEKLLQQISFLN